MATSQYEAHIPPMAMFPAEKWRIHLLPEDWKFALETWIKLAKAHISLSISQFLKISANDDSLPAFVKSYVTELVKSRGSEIIPVKYAREGKELRKLSFQLLYQLQTIGTSSKESLLDWVFLSHVVAEYGLGNGKLILSKAWEKNDDALQSSLNNVKTYIITELSAAPEMAKSWKQPIETIEMLGRLICASPEAAELLMAGTDFMDALVHGFENNIHPDLRNAVTNLAYVSLTGITNAESPKYTHLVDQIYHLKTATQSQTSKLDDSLAARLVTKTNLLRVIRKRMDENGQLSARAGAAFSALEATVGFKPSNGKKTRKIDKGKAVATQDDQNTALEDHAHSLQQQSISEVLQIFPDLGEGFIVRLLRAYGNNSERVISQLLDESLPSDLANADRQEPLQPSRPTPEPRPAPIRTNTISSLPIRRNVFDDDDFDRLSMNPSNLHFGRKNANKTADDILEDKSMAPNKAAILSALAAFDSDDDERDDTYDMADVGGTVDSATTGNETTSDIQDSRDETLFLAYKSTPKIFARDAATRRDVQRETLREKTGMTDEAIEGWAIMLSRNPREQRRLESKFTAFSGLQPTLAPSSWKASPAGSDQDSDAIDHNARGRGGRLRGAGRGRGRGRGNVAGPTGDRDTEAARRGKEANKGQRANHNRRDQRAKKMARGGGGFPPAS